MMTQSKPSQTFLPGIVTEDEIIRAHYRKIGAKGGAVRSPKQTRSRRRLMKQINERRSRREQDG